MKKVPIRTCLGCGRKSPKTELRRFVASPAGEVVPDPGGKGYGRGAYCCENESCFRLFVKKEKKVLRALRVREETRK